MTAARRLVIRLAGLTFILLVFVAFGALVHGKAKKNPEPGATAHVYRVTGQSDCVQGVPVTRTTGCLGAGFALPPGTIGSKVHPVYYNGANFKATGALVGTYWIGDDGQDITIKIPYNSGDYFTLWY